MPTNFLMQSHAHACNYVNVHACSLFMNCLCNYVINSDVIYTSIPIEVEYNANVWRVRGGWLYTYSSYCNSPLNNKNTDYSLISFCINHFVEFWDFCSWFNACLIRLLFSMLYVMFCSRCPTKTPLLLMPFVDAHYYM